MTKKRHTADKGNVETALLADIRELIQRSRHEVAVTVNQNLTMLYWHIGKRINHEIQEGKRAEYGKEIVATLWRQLSQEYGNGFSAKYLRRMVQFNEGAVPLVYLPSLLLGTEVPS